MGAIQPAKAHFNTEPQGTAARNGTLLPTLNQTHLTLEPTIGVPPNFAVGFMFLSAGNRVTHPSSRDGACCRTFTPPSPGACSFRLGFVSEFSFQNERYEENTRRVELRPILDREFSRWQIVFNPVFERALHGPGTEHGWNFEPAALLRWRRKNFSPSLEYYGEIESVNVPPRAQPEVHQLFVGGDWDARPGFSINLGAGFDLGAAGPGDRLEKPFPVGLGSAAEASDACELMARQSEFVSTRQPLPLVTAQYRTGFTEPRPEEAVLKDSLTSLEARERCGPAACWRRTPDRCSS